MSCERCAVREATVQVKVVHDGEPREMQLCPVCVMVEAHRNVLPLPPDLGGAIPDELPVA